MLTHTPETASYHSQEHLKAAAVLVSACEKGCASVQGDMGMWMVLLIQRRETAASEARTLAAPRLPLSLPFESSALAMGATDGDGSVEGDVRVLRK